jgi:hypothetical protein
MAYMVNFRDELPALRTSTFTGPDKIEDATMTVP